MKVYTVVRNTTLLYNKRMNHIFVSASVVKSIKLKRLKQYARIRAVAGCTYRNDVS